MKLFSFVALMLFTGSAFAADYTVDPDHSTIGFKVRHLGISSVAGRFAKVDGNFSYDPQNIAASKAEATIDANTIDTDHEKRDKHLRSDEFLDTTKYPAIKFVSKEIKDVEGSSFKVLGDLTVHGVTKPVTLDAEFLGATKDPWGNERAGFEAEASINRKDFGMTWNKILETGGFLVGEDVKIVLAVEGIKKKA